MIIHYINGGLANQIMMYVFGRFMERRNPNQTLLFDDTYFHLYKILNGYELENVFGIKLNLFSQYFDRDTWEGILSLQKKQPLLPQIPRFYYDSGLPMVMLTNHISSLNYFPGLTIFPEQIEPDKWNLPYRNIYCWHGLWMDKYWFEQDREDNLRELTFPQLTDKKNLNYVDEINAHNMSVGIHIRMGAYTEYTPQLIHKYRLACQDVLDKFPDACFFVFSDKLDWCKAHAAEMGLNLAAHTVYIEGNDHGKNYIDMQLMSMCHGIICSRLSTFSRVAKWLNPHLELDIALEEMY